MIVADFDRDLEATLRGRLAGGTLALLENVLAQLEQEAEAKALKLLKAGKGLTPEQATQAWYEKYAICALRDRLRHLASAGHSASKRIAPGMELTHGSKENRPEATRPV